jgi:hypothetical protein
MFDKLKRFIFGSNPPPEEPQVTPTFTVSIPYYTINYGRMRGWLSRNCVGTYEITRNNKLKQHDISFTNEDDALRFKEAWR